MPPPHSAYLGSSTSSTGTTGVLDMVVSLDPAPRTLVPSTEPEPSNVVVSSDQAGLRALATWWISFFLGVSLPCIGIYVSVLPYTLERRAKAAPNPIVDRNTCSCSCWDGLFKGPYPTGALNMYFNFEIDTFYMFGWIYLAMSLLHSLITYVQYFV